MKYFKLYTTVYCLFFLFISSTAFGQTIEVVTEEWPPYNYTVDGEIAGSSTKIIKKALKAANIKYTIRSYPWARAYKVAQEKPNVLIYTIVRTEQREPLFKWVSEIQPSVSTYLYKRSDREEVMVTDLEEAFKFSVAVTRSAYSEQYLRKLGFSHNTNLIVTSYPFRGLQMLMSGRADLLAESSENLKSILADADINPKDVSPAVFLKDFKFYAAFSKGTDDKLVARLRTALEQTFAHEKSPSPTTN
ncbi:MAG: transporter substrate-binding domain-containing protein [Halopseudomonas aestusnigri]